jgi:DNA repair exonuclease SbcCD nuclease subunit
MHLADLHLGAPQSYLGEKAAQRAGELESALLRALEAAPERNVHAILIAGDLFDTFDPAPELVARVKAAFRKTSDAGAPIILIPGTHDSHRYARCVYGKTQFPGVDILLEAGEPLRKRLGDCEVFFYGFSGGGKSGKDTPPFRRGPGEGLHVALVHGPVSDGTHWASSPRDYPLSPAEIEQSGFDYVALGHYHDFREHRFGKATAVYPGTLEGLKFGEDGDRYLVTAQIGEDGVSIEKVKHNRRALSEIHIDLATSAIGSIEGLVSTIEKRGDSNAIVRVSLTGATDFLPPIRGIESRLGELFFHLEISDETSVVGGGLIRAITNEDTVRGIFARKMLDKIERGAGEERALAEFALRLGIEQFIRVEDENSQGFD